jgi:hypothetical protein
VTRQKAVLVHPGIFYWNILKGAKGRTGHGDKSQLQGCADPMTRSEGFTDHSPVVERQK